MGSDAAAAQMRHRLRLATCAGRWIPSASDSSGEADSTGHCWSVWEVAAPGSSACYFLVGMEDTVSDRLHYSASAADTSPALVAGRPFVLPPLAAFASAFDADDREGLQLGLIHNWGRVPKERDTGRSEVNGGGSESAGGAVAYSSESPPEPETPASSSDPTTGLFHAAADIEIAGAPLHLDFQVSVGCLDQEHPFRQNC